MSNSTSEGSKPARANKPRHSVPLEKWAHSQPRELTTLTIAFTDIVRSTYLCNSMGNKQWIDILILHFAKARELLCQHNCYEIKIIGDSFMVAFRNAVDALKFTLAFHKSTGHETVKIRAGIHTGAVRIIDNDIYGGMVNYASRVMGSSKGDDITLSNTAKEQIDDEYGTRRSRELFIRATHMFDDYDEEKTLWRVNCEEWWVTRLRKAIPAVEELGERAGVSDRCRIEAATPADIDWVADLQIRTYSSEDAIPRHILKEWYATNPNGFSIIKAKGGDRIGHIDILPLRPEATQTVLEGRTLEREFRGTLLFSEAERGSITDLYVESIIILTPDRPLAALALYSLLANFTLISSRVADPSNLNNIYAIAATESGERLMRQLGFSEIRAAETRADHHPLFVAKFADVAANIDTLLNQSHGIVTEA